MFITYYLWASKPTPGEAIEEWPKLLAEYKVDSYFIPPIGSLIIYPSKGILKYELRDKVLFKVVNVEVECDRLDADNGGNPISAHVTAVKQGL